MQAPIGEFWFQGQFECKLKALRPIPSEEAEHRVRDLRDRLAAQSRLFEGIASTTPDFIYVFDLEGRFLFANRSLLEVWGRTAADALGKNLYELGYPQWHADMHMRELRQVRETKQPVKGEVSFTGGSGISGIYEYIFTPVLGPEGEVEMIAGTTRDVTERKRLLGSERAARAEAESASRAKDHFLAVLSHELRTPLTPVLAAVSFLEGRPDLPEDLRREIGMIRRNVELEARLVDDLLDVTRIGHGKVELRREQLDIHALIAAAVESARPQIRHRRLLLAEELRAGRHHAWADAVRMRQVVSNLIDNAVKFTPEGGSVTIRTSNTPGDGLRVEVADTGMGIDPEVLPRLFNPFEQGDRKVTRGYGGLGLGLSIAKGLLNLHGADLTAASEGKGRGASFTFTLAPAAEAPPPAPAQPAPPCRDSAGRARPCNVLLVEDHDDTRRVMARMLRQFGCAVKTAATVAEAAGLIEREPIDLLISDIGLPDGAGLEVMRLARAKGIPGAALSGFGQDEDLRASREAGFETHLIKPVTSHALEEMVRRLAARTAPT